jgi:hypothetical protein
VVGGTAVDKALKKRLNVSVPVDDVAIAGDDPTIFGIEGRYRCRVEMWRT